MINSLLVTEKNLALDKISGRSANIPCLSQLRQILVDELVINNREVKKKVKTEGSSQKINKKQ